MIKDELVSKQVGSSIKEPKPEQEFTQEQIQWKAKAILEEVDTKSRSRTYKGPWDKVMMVFSTV